jgi:hypothetical protein
VPPSKAPAAKVHPSGAWVGLGGPDERRDAEHTGHRSYLRTEASMFLLGILSPFLEDENPIDSDALVESPPALSCPRQPRPRFPFCSSILEETGSGVARRPLRPQRGVGL